MGAVAPKTNKLFHFTFTLFFVTHPASRSMGIEESFYRAEVAGV